MSSLELDFVPLSVFTMSSLAPAKSPAMASISEANLSKAETCSRSRSSVLDAEMVFPGEDMATVIGIFENLYKQNKYLTVVKPGTQTRRFTHIDDTIEAVYFAWKKNKNRHYSISNKKSYSIIKVAKLFTNKIKFLPKRKGERYASALSDMNLSNKVYKLFGKTL